MTIFDKAFEHLVRWEGFYANVEGDAGGETYMGISRKANPKWNGWDVIDHYKLKYGYLRHNQRIENADLESQVKAFYKIKYWDAIRLDEVHHSELAQLVFDTYVHSGKKAILLLQGSANELIIGTRSSVLRLKEDGIIGDKTLAAVNTLDGNRLYNRMKHNRKLFLMQLCVKDSYKKFLKGFMARIDSFPNLPEGSNLA